MFPVCVPLAVRTVSSARSEFRLQFDSLLNCVGRLGAAFVIVKMSSSRSR